MNEEFLYYFAIGFLAQLVDGALGMAYGVTSTTCLISLGISPASASASVHAAEIFTTGASGLSHLYLRNIDWRLFRALVAPGIAGSVIGACLLSLLPVAPIRTGVALYLAVMGMVILVKALGKEKSPPARGVRGAGLGFCGGFFDAMGGGGWGPIVASSLVARGNTPRFTVGSVSLAEFFVALAASATFSLTIGIGSWTIITGLVAGGILAAPLAALLCKKLPVRMFMFLLGVLIVILSLRVVGQGF